MCVGRGRGRATQRERDNPNIKATFPGSGDGAFRAVEKDKYESLIHCSRKTSLQMAKEQHREQDSLLASYVKGSWRRNVWVIGWGEVEAFIEKIGKEGCWLTCSRTELDITNILQDMSDFCSYITYFTVYYNSGVTSIALVRKIDCLWFKCILVF
jgi:hypothetical protein